VAAPFVKPGSAIRATSSACTSTWSWPSSAC